MAGRGPAPKPKHQRRRRNKKPGATTLPPPEVPKEPKKVPTLPNPDKRKWHRLTRAWWRRVWTSPMASEYLETDVDGLGRLALLVDAYYNGDTSLASEIRLQEARFGLSPVDRSRLGWEVPKSDAGRAQNPAPTGSGGPPGGGDPRAALRVVK